MPRGMGYGKKVTVSKSPVKKKKKTSTPKKKRKS